MTEVPKRKNKVKPTKKQAAFFDELKRAKDLREAGRRAGYSEKTIMSPKQNIMDTEGFRVLLDQHREELRKAGVSIELLAEIQATGLLDKDAKVRLEYVKEAKKDFGIFQPDNKPTKIMIGIGLSKADYGY